MLAPADVLGCIQGCPGMYPASGAAAGHICRKFISTLSFLSFTHEIHPMPRSHGPPPLLVTPPTGGPDFPSFQAENLLIGHLFPAPRLRPQNPQDSFLRKSHPLGDKEQLLSSLPPSLLPAGTWAHVPQDHPSFLAAPSSPISFPNTARGSPTLIPACCPQEAGSPLERRSHPPHHGRRSPRTGSLPMLLSRPSGFGQPWCTHTSWIQRATS